MVKNIGSKMGYFENGVHRMPVRNYDANTSASRRTNPAPIATITTQQSVNVAVDLSRKQARMLKKFQSNANKMASSGAPNVVVVVCGAALHAHKPQPLS